MKFDQIAIATPEPETAIQIFQDLGLLNPDDEWVQDVATGTARVWDSEPEELRGELKFNYDLADIKEFELLTYGDGNDWLSRSGVTLPTVSHLGVHVSHEEAAEVIGRAAYLGLSIAQQVATHSHENAYLIERERTYVYTIIHTRTWLGFDVKLIERIEGGDDG